MERLAAGLIVEEDPAGRFRAAIQKGLTDFSGLPQVKEYGPKLGRAERVGVRLSLVDLTRFVSVAPTDTEAFHSAAFLPLPDFEDALQVAAARACGASYIVTRNVKDFRESPIPARTPSEILAELT